MFPAVAGMTGAHHHAWLFSIDMGFQLLFCLGWPWTTILLISASQVARITGVSHWCLPHMLNFECLFPRAGNTCDNIFPRCRTSAASWVSPSAAWWWERQATLQCPQLWGDVFSGLSVSNAVFTLQYFQVIMAFGEHNPMVSQGASICVWFQRSKWSLWDVVTSLRWQN
jgi:hypothetical protein